MMAVAIGVLTATVPSSALAATGTAPVPTLKWSDCGDGLQCATAQVPLDYSHPFGSTIQLALARLPASDRSHRIGSLFLNPGGPGSSGVDFVRLHNALLPPPIRAQFDLVGFDPRGVNLSSPVRCFNSSEEKRNFLAKLPPFPVGTEQEDTFIQAMKEFGRLCADRNAELLPHMATANAARDLDLLREAVGDAKLSYLGLSYGTFLGATYANLFPSHVRAAILDGAVDPIAQTTGRGLEGSLLPVSIRNKSDLGSAKALGEFLRLCQAGGMSACSFASTDQGAGDISGDLTEKFDTLVERLRSNPIIVSEPGAGQFSVTYAFLMAVVGPALYSPARWPTLADLLQDLWQRSTGKPGDADSTSERLARLSKGGAHPPVYDNYFDSWGATTCADSTNPSQASAWPLAARLSDERSRYFGSYWTWGSAICIDWKATDRDRYQGPWNQNASGPILVIGNRFDPATRYENAVTLSGLLKRGRLLTLDGWGHTAYGRSACVGQFEVAYLVSGQLPVEGTVCKPDQVPFAPG